MIRTARTEAEINQAVRDGLFPLVKLLSPSPQIKTKFAVFQNTDTGEISVSHDLRVRHGGEPVIGFSFYYPYSFPSPFAAYLIPNDLEIDEVVFIEDLIEDVVGMRSSQGDAYRLDSCIAKWDGENFILQYDQSDAIEILG